MSGTAVRTTAEDLATKSRTKLRLALFISMELFLASHRFLPEDYPLSYSSCFPITGPGFMKVEISHNPTNGAGRSACTHPLACSSKQPWLVRPATFSIGRIRKQMYCLTSFPFFSFLFFLFQNLRVELRQQTWNWRSGIVINEQTSKIGPQLATKSNVQIDSR